MEVSALIDPIENRMVQSLRTDQELLLRPFVFGEVIKLRIAKTKRIAVNGSDLLRVPIDISTSSLRVGLGTALVGPVSGSFTLEFSGDTAALGYNFTASDLNLALAAMSAVGSAGGAAATQVSAGIFEIRFNTTGAKAMFTAEDVDGLFPSSSVEILPVQVGDAGTHAIQSIRLVQNAAVEIAPGDFAASAGPTASVAVLVVGSPTHDCVIRVSFDGDPYAGFFTLTFIDLGGGTSPLIPWGISASDLETLLGTTPEVSVDGDLVPNVEIQQEDEGSYVFHFRGNLALSDVGEITASGAALRGVVYMEGLLDLRDVDGERLLGSAGSVGLILDVEETPAGGNPEKLLRLPVTLVPPVLNVQAP